MTSQRPQTLRVTSGINAIEARSDALYGAWLCGTVLGNVGMALHHKLCHTLGGSFNLSHAETHAIVLPHALGGAEGHRPESGGAGSRLRPRLAEPVPQPPTA